MPKIQKIIISEKSTYLELVYCKAMLREISSAVRLLEDQTCALGFENQGAVEVAHPVKPEQIVNERGDLFSEDGEKWRSWAIEP